MQSRTFRLGAFGALVAGAAFIGVFAQGGDSPAFHPADKGGARGNNLSVANRGNTRMLYGSVSATTGFQTFPISANTELDVTQITYAAYRHSGGAADPVVNCYLKLSNTFPSNCVVPQGNTVVQTFSPPLKLRIGDDVGVGGAGNLGKGSIQVEVTLYGVIPNAAITESVTVQ